MGWQKKKRENLFRSTKGQEIVESHDNQHPVGTWHIEEDVQDI